MMVGYEVTGPRWGFSPCTDAARRKADPWNETWMPPHGTCHGDGEKTLEAALILPGWEWGEKVVGMGHTQNERPGEKARDASTG
jgi:hypothetical protein